MGKPTTIPLSYSDFIFASICEEMGVFMGMAVIMLLLILVYRGYKIALAQKHNFPYGRHRDYVYICHSIVGYFWRSFEVDSAYGNYDSFVTRRVQFYRVYRWEAAITQRKSK